MRIWHEKLIPHLCQKHLCACWRESLGAYSIITENKKGYRNHPAVKEFIGYEYKLYGRLMTIRTEMLSRGYHPKEMPEKYYAFSFGKEEYKEWQTLEEQIEILRGKGCKCKIDNIKTYET